MLDSSLLIDSNGRVLTISAINKDILHITVGRAHSRYSNNIIVCECTPVALIDSQTYGDIIKFSTPGIKGEYNKKLDTFTFLNNRNEIIINEKSSAREITDQKVNKNIFDENSKRVIINGADGRKSTVMGYKEVYDRTALATKLSLDLNEDEHLFGLGSHEESYYELRGTRVQLYQHNLKKSVPFLVSSKGYGILYDTFSFITFDDTASRATIEASPNEVMSYYICFGENTDKVIAGYRFLTGESPMLPKWSAGYIQSKERYKTQEEIEQVVAKHRALNIPIDCIILDWHSWEGKKWGQKTFDLSRFPDPKVMVDFLHGNNVHFMISIWPNMDESTENYREMLDNNCLLTDYSNYNTFEQSGRELYWKQVEEGLMPAGIDGWWCDSSEPWVADWDVGGRDNADYALGNMNEFAKFLDKEMVNGYSLYHSKAIYEGQRASSCIKRVINLNRSSYAGAQRYANVAWSGDISASWQTLRNQVFQMLNYTLSGMPYWTFDIGGFFVKNNSNLWFWSGEYEQGVADLGYRELYTRWFWLGAFLSMFRSHGTDTPREVWQFGSSGEMFYESMLSAIKIRYELLPYIYSYFAKTTYESGTLNRHMMFDFANDPKIYDYKTQFMFGESILVCPVVEPMYYDKGSKAIDMDKTIDIYLPNGSDFFCYFDKNLYKGGQTHRVKADISHIPLFVKAGSIIPKIMDAQYAGDILNADLTIEVYAGADAEFKLYDDDGATYNYESGQYLTRQISWNDTKNVLVIGSIKGDGIITKITAIYDIIVYYDKVRYSLRLTVPQCGITLEVGEIGGKHGDAKSVKEKR